MDSSHATKSCVLILLVTLLCAERAQGLECYQCMGVPVGIPCPSITCSYTDGFCIYQEAEVTEGSQRLKVKNSYCHPSCPDKYENIASMGPSVKVKISCCKEDLCNAAVPTGGSTWTMAGVLLFSLSSVLLQTLL